MYLVVQEKKTARVLRERVGPPIIPSTELRATRGILYHKPLNLDNRTFDGVPQERYRLIARCGAGEEVPLHGWLKICAKHAVDSGGTPASLSHITKQALYVTSINFESAK